MTIAETTVQNSSSSSSPLLAMTKKVPNSKVITVKSVAPKTTIQVTSIDQRSNDEKVQKLWVLLSQARKYSEFLVGQISKEARQTPKEQHSYSEEEEKFEQPKLFTGGNLRQYQLEGVQWLISLYENGLNGILADEMGLGKTVQCIAFLAFLRERGILGPFLIIAPLSTLPNWTMELERFAPSIPKIMYTGNPIEREKLRKQFHNTKVANDQRISVLITSYELAIRDAKYLAPINWKYMMIDEGHRLKNLNCRLIRELRDYKSANRLLFTGTPFHNNLTELWSLLNFLLPQIFTNLGDFLEWFDIDVELTDEADRAEMVAHLHAILKPLLLRRLKSDVEKELPRKREYILYAQLTPKQLEYYQIILEGRARELVYGVTATKDELITKQKRIKRSKHSAKSYKELEESDLEIDSQLDNDDEEEQEQEEDDDKGENEERMKKSSCKYKGGENGNLKGRSIPVMQGLQNKFMQLRKACNHPYLFTYPIDPTNPSCYLVDRNLFACSGKMQLLDQLLAELLCAGHKVLIFSQMSRMLDIIGDYLDWKGEKYCRIDGSVPIHERQAEMKRFDSDKTCSVFLLSTRAGGLGLNLVAADTVIFFDSDWNPQMDLQAQDRVHRIGQTKPVLIFRLATRNTIEARMLERASSKRKLERLILHKKKFKGRKQLLEEDKLLVEELLEILKAEERDGENFKFDDNNHIQKRKRGQQGPLSKEELALILDRSNAAFDETVFPLASKSIKRVSSD